MTPSSRGDGRGVGVRNEGLSRGLVRPASDREWPRSASDTPGASGPPEACSAVDASVGAGVGPGSTLTSERGPDARRRVFRGRLRVATLVSEASPPSGAVDSVAAASTTSGVGTRGMVMSSMAVWRGWYRVGGGVSGIAHSPRNTAPCSATETSNVRRVATGRPWCLTRCRCVQPGGTDTPSSVGAPVCGGRCPRLGGRQSSRAGSMRRADRLLGLSRKPARLGDPSRPIGEHRRDCPSARWCRTRGRREHRHHPDSPSSIRCSPGRCRCR